MISKQTIIAFVLGAIAVAFVYHAYTVYSFKKTITQHSIVLQQIVALINSNQPK